MIISKTDENWEIKKIEEMTIACKGKVKLLQIETEDGSVFTINIKELPIKMAKLKS